MPKGEGESYPWRLRTSEGTCSLWSLLHIHPWGGSPELCNHDIRERPGGMDIEISQNFYVTVNPAGGDLGAFPVNTMATLSTAATNKTVAAVNKRFTGDVTTADKAAIWTVASL